MTTENNYRILVIDDITEIHQDFRKILLPEENKSQQFLKEMNENFFGKELTPEQSKLPPFIIDSAYQSQDGITAVKKAISSRMPYALAFVDVQMPPGEDGVETITQMWKIDPNIQTVICTAYAKYDWQQLNKLFGDTDRLYVLKKPFDNLEVIQLACSLTKKWNLNRDVNEKLLKLQEQMEHSPKEQKPANLNPELEKSLNSLKEATEALKAFNKKVKDKKNNP